MGTKSKMLNLHRFLQVCNCKVFYSNALNVIDESAKRNECIIDNSKMSMLKNFLIWILLLSSLIFKDHFCSTATFACNLNNLLFKVRNENGNGNVSKVKSL